MEVRQTGVTDGKVVVARAYAPVSRRNASVGRRPAAMPRSRRAGVSPSMTARTSFLRNALVLRQHAQAGVALSCSLREPAARDGCSERLEVPEQRHVGERDGKKRRGGSGPPGETPGNENG